MAGNKQYRKRLHAILGISENETASVSRVERERYNIEMSIAGSLYKTDLQYREFIWKASDLDPLRYEAIGKLTVEDFLTLLKARQSKNNGG